ncbi:hypothetical protein CcrSwift_gp125 [Caulobacter phage CcrSwift]|uniref:Uncharacterized protein n=1 Tax=Caulobacter phage CcrSwift TaxID=2927984 RepID=K4JX05_9CAUD|nr:hypothetical protein CcrMagneto_gp126 [Caulobacter virus Magneto]YP_006989858.1 hypothetical protein D870_gp296 [Caulobacter phage CcrSwift]AFU87296.1 hypothetical protein CcrMagneto_gp126 [Caulobacter virus Magneto]AFU88443.1 hypothetical protein CcrSwift_gp125 [Caulobacter phage CcrSwift]
MALETRLAPRPADRSTELGISCDLWSPSRLVACSRPAFASWAIRGPGRSWFSGSPAQARLHSPRVPLGAVSKGRCCACNEGSLGGKADEIKSRPPRPFPFLGRPALRLATSRRPRERGGSGITTCFPSSRARNSPSAARRVLLLLTNRCLGRLAFGSVPTFAAWKARRRG